MNSLASMPGCTLISPYKTSVIDYDYRRSKVLLTNQPLLYL